jgi:hypothetical protein
MVFCSLEESIKCNFEGLLMVSRKKIPLSRKEERKGKRKRRGGRETVQM